MVIIVLFHPCISYQVSSLVTLSTKFSLSSTRRHQVVVLIRDLSRSGVESLGGVHTRGASAAGSFGDSLFISLAH